MCFVCLSYYLRDRNRADDDDRHGDCTQVLVGLRIDRMAHDEWHDCRNRRVMCDDRLGDGVPRKAPHN